MTWLEGLLVSTTDSPITITEDGANLSALPNEVSEEAAVELGPAPESVPQGTLFCLLPFF